MQGSQLPAGGQFCMTRTYRSPGLLVSGLLVGRGRSCGLRGLGGKKDLALKHPGVFMEWDMCSPSPQAEEEWGDWRSLHLPLGQEGGAGRGYYRISETVGIQLTVCPLHCSHKEARENRSCNWSPESHGSLLCSPPVLTATRSPLSSFSHLPPDLLVSADGYQGAAAAQTPSGWIPEMGES